MPPAASRCAAHPLRSVHSPRFSLPPPSDPKLGNTDQAIEVGDKVVNVSASFGDDVWEALNFGQVRGAAGLVLLAGLVGWCRRGSLVAAESARPAGLSRTLRWLSFCPPQQVVYAIKTRNGQVYLRLKRNFGDMSALQVRAAGWRCRLQAGCLQRAPARR